MDNYPISSNSLEKFFYIDGNHFGQQYKEHLSNYNSWDQKDHAHEWILFSNNIGSYLSIDETSLSNGELYTVLTNKEGKGKKGTLIAMIEGTDAERVIDIISLIPENAFIPFRILRYSAAYPGLPLELPEEDAAATITRQSFLI